MAKTEMILQVLSDELGLPVKSGIRSRPAKSLPPAKRQSLARRICLAQRRLRRRHFLSRRCLTNH